MRPGVILAASCGAYSASHGVEADYMYNTGDSRSRELSLLALMRYWQATLL